MIRLSSGEVGDHNIRESFDPRVTVHTPIKSFKDQLVSVPIFFVGPVIFWAFKS